MRKAHRTVTSHAGLAGDTGRDEDDLRALEGLAEAGGSGLVASDSAVGVDVAQVSSDTCRRAEDILYQYAFAARKVLITRIAANLPGPPRMS